MREARALLNAGHPSAAYYLLGYAVECGLKAVIARRSRAGEFPNLKRARDAYSHDFRQLAKVAGLTGSLNAEIARSAGFSSNWNAVASWRSISRYEVHTVVKTRGLYRAVTARKTGVMQWIRNQW